MTFSHALSTNNYGPCKFIVATSAANGTHTTLASAMAAASVGDTIFLRDSVTENITLTPGVNIAAWSGVLLNTPSITGKITMTGAGTSTISGICLITNSDFFLAVTGSAASQVRLKGCYLSLTNNTGISYTSSSSSSYIECIDCEANITTTGITYFVATGAGGITLDGCTFNNSGASTTASSTSACPITIYNSTAGIALSTSSAGLVNAFNSYFNTGNATSLTTAGTGASELNNCDIASGTATTLSAGSGTTIKCYTCTISSSNASAIGGAGTVTYGDLAFSSTSAVINPTTNTPVLTTNVTKVVRQVFTSTGTYTPTTGMKYCDIECVGGGGGGGSALATGATTFSVAGGGGGGEYSRGIFSAATIGASKSVTIGAAGAAGTAGGAGGTGGTTSVGATDISAIGGTGGAASAGAHTGGDLYPGGAGGTGGSGGDFRVQGSPGGCGLAVLATGGFGQASGGIGGSTYFGGGALAIGTLNTSSAGNAATGYGGGGGGGANITSQSAVNGGAGFKGVVIVTEYI